MKQLMKPTSAIVLLQNMEDRELTFRHLLFYKCTLCDLVDSKLSFPMVTDITTDRTKHSVAYEPAVD